MKQINEALQMKVFDLLEGNLSEKEKAEVLNLIAASPELQKEYELMSKTYLQEEPAIVFADKHKLYRRPGMAVIWKPLMRYAAAAAILAVCGYAGWFFSRQNTNGQTTMAKTKTEHTLKTLDSAPAPVGVEEKAEAHFPGQKQEENRDAAEVVTDYQIKPLTKPVKQGTEELAQTKHQNAETDVLIADHDVVAMESETSSFENPENLDSTTNGISQQPPVRSGKKRSLSYKLLNNGRQMLANLQLPDVRFRTEKKANRAIPTLKMEIRTLKTDVIATLIE